MKKIYAFCVMLTALLLVSCWGKKVDASRWIDTLEDGLIAAKSEDKKIILFFSADDQDVLSEVLKENLLNKEEFITAETENYVLVNLDFSDSVYDATFVDEDASKEEKANALALWKKLDQNVRTANFYGVDMSPSFYLLSKEGYVLSQLAYDDSLGTIAQFEDEIDSHAEDIAKLEAALARVNATKGVEKVLAIDDVFALTPERCTYPLMPLARQVQKLDRKNESGLVGKYVFITTEADVTEASLDNDVEKAIAIFDKAKENAYLDTDQKQLMNYFIGYFLGSIGSTDYGTIRSYLQTAYDLNPQSDMAESILQRIRIMDERINETIEMNQNVQIVPGNADLSAEGEENAADSTNTFTIE